MSVSPESRSPGEAIAAARRQRGLSSEDLAERTKIPVAMLAALEADQYHRLSGPLYARSFLRTCARELGLDAQEVLDLYARHSGETVRPAGEPVRAPEAVRIRRVGLPWGRLAMAAAAVAGIGALAVVLMRPEPGDPVVAGSSGGGTVVTAADVAATAATMAPVTDPGPIEPNGVPAGLPQLRFADGSTWPLVVRLRSPGPVPALARPDDATASTETVWSTTGAPPPPLDGAPVAGRAYADGQGLVVYWGAVERLRLVLAWVDGCELTVNGVPQALVAPPDGAEVILELKGAASPPLP